MGGVRWEKDRERGRDGEEEEEERGLIDQRGAFRFCFFCVCGVRCARVVRVFIFFLNF